MPNRFVRAGLLHVRNDYAWDCPVYLFEPADDFVVDGVIYSMNSYGRTAGSMLDLIDDIDGRCHPHRMNWANPPTEQELDRWVHAPHPTREYIYDERTHNGFTNG